MNEQETLIWKVLDGSASPEERAELEKLLDNEPSLRTEFLERERLSKELKTMETEQPSLRFAQNLMEKLPEIYQRAIAPLVNPWLIRLFFGALGIFVLSFFGAVIYGIQNGQVTGGSFSNSLAEQLLSPFKQISSPLLTLVFSLSLGYLGLIWLDRLLKKKLLK